MTTAAKIQPLRLFVAGIAYEATEAELAALVGSVCRVVDCKIVRDRETGASRGFGFVDVLTPSDALTAIKCLDGACFLGRTIAVKHAEDRRPPLGWKVGA